MRTTRIKLTNRYTGYAIREAMHCRVQPAEDDGERIEDEKACARGVRSGADRRACGEVVQDHVEPEGDGDAVGAMCGGEAVFEVMGADGQALDRRGERAWRAYEVLRSRI